MNARSIRIFLASGTPNGLRTVEVGLSTIKALIAPRTAMEELKLREEVNATGVYLLVGEDPEIPGRLAVYIGEGDSVIRRILSHDESKDFWHTSIVFVSKDENLTKAHARWLEARLIELGDAARRATLMNDARPAGGSLPEADRAEMTEFIEQIRIILGTIGFDVFAPEPDRSVSKVKTIAPSAIAFTCSADGYSATATLSGGTFVVRKGSSARKGENASLQATYRSLRKTMLSTGVLADSGAHFTFTQDYAFNSPSMAASVVAGSSANGRTMWRLDNGTTYGDWEKSHASLPPDPPDADD